MNRILSSAIGLGMCFCAGSVWAQSPGAGNPCGVGHAANGNGGGGFINLGFGATVATEAGDCNKDRAATHLFLMWKDTHDPQLYDAAVRVMCTEDVVREANPALCAAATPSRVAVIPSQTALAHVAAAPIAVLPPAPVAPAAPPLIAITSTSGSNPRPGRPIELHPNVSVWAHCPAGAPLSECSP